ncbi:MAG: type IV pilus twitching motility protein PilT [Thermodesulfobacteriota bacterium]
MDLKTILEIAVKEGSSDVHLKAGLPPIYRINGSLIPLKNADRISPEGVEKLALNIMSEDQKNRFKTNYEVDMAYSLPGVGRFRINVFQQRGTVNVVLRVVPMIIHSFERLNLPEILKKVSMEVRGLILLTGMTGCGKTTTLASMIDYINNNRSCHIITIEDPIEFLHRDKKSIIGQREIGIDTGSFKDALRSAMRQDPDVILVGEMRDLETMEVAMTAAETGHLVLSTLHTIDATEAINRIVSVFPPYQQQQIRNQLASVLKGVVSQRLIPKKDGQGRVPAVEVLLSTARIRECIVDRDKTDEITDAIVKGHSTYGMQTFDQSLMDLLNKDLISYEEAMLQASRPSDFALKVQGITSAGDTGWGHIEEENEDRNEETTVDRF